MRRQRGLLVEVDGERRPRNGRRMSKRQERHAQSERSAGGQTRRARQARARRRLWARSLAVVLPLALVLVASLAPIGQARSARERSPEEEALAASQKAAKKEERRNAVRQEREERAAARKAQPKTDAHSNPGPAKREQEHVTVTFSCTGVTWEFRGFRDTPSRNNTVIETVVLNHGAAISESFTFTGTSGSNTTAFAAPPGHYTIDARGHWRSRAANGLAGGFDLHAPVSCSPTPALSVEKLQTIEGSGSPYTASPLTGVVGQVVDYQIKVTNTGNVPLSLGFTDEHCDPGTITGGPGGAELAVGTSTTYDCTHLLGGAGQYSNTAEVTGTPPDGDGSPVSESSKTVVVEALPPPPPAPAFTIEKLQKIEGASGSYTTSQLPGLLGQTVDYEIVLENTGNVPLTLPAFTDSQCDAGTISGGPFGGVLGAGSTTVYRCSHRLDAADQTSGSYSNTVTLTLTPPEGDGAPITNGSNTVVVTVAPSGSTPGGQTPPSGSSTSSSPSSGVLSSSSVGEASKSGVLAFSSTAVPAFKGPQGCVRSGFRVSIKAAGVASVSFYMDGRKLRTLTSRNARKGLLTIAIDPTKLKVGAHRLTARITMAATKSTKARTAARSVTVLRCAAAALTPRFTG